MSGPVLSSRFEELTKLGKVGSKRGSAAGARAAAKAIETGVAHAGPGLESFEFLK